MNRKIFLIGGCLGLLISLGVLMANQSASAEAERCYLVSIGDPAQPGAEFTIKPQDFRVPLESCVIWVNWSKVAQVQIIFKEGLKCKDATTGATGFTLNSGVCYVTNYLSHGATSSLVFTKEGMYDYTVESKSGGKLSGKITVFKE